LGDGVDTAVAQVEARLTTTLQRTQAIRDRAQAFAARDLDDTAANGALSAIGAHVVEELSPAIERLGDAKDSVRDRIDSLNRLVRLANRLTGADLPTIQPGEFAVMTEGISTAKTQVASLRARIADRRIEARQAVADDITRLTLGVDAVVEPIQQRIVTVRTRGATLAECVDALPGRIDAQLLLPTALGVTVLSPGAAWGRPR
jgi:hypothetical protein